MIPFSAEDAHGHLALGRFLGEAQSLLAEAVEVAPMPSALNEDERRAAEELLTTVDADDFQDALQASLLTVNTWARNPRRRNLISYSCDLSLGEHAGRVAGAYEKIAAFADPSRMREPKKNFDYESALYSDRIHPSTRVLMCEMLFGHAAHLAVLLGIERGQRLPSHVADGLAGALERCAVAMTKLKALQNS